MEEALRQSQERLRLESQLVEISSAPMFIWEFDGAIVQWNRGSEELYGFTADEAASRPKEEVLGTTAAGSSFAAIKETLARTGRWSGELDHVAKDGRHLTVESRMDLIEFGDRRYVLESIRDITAARAWDERQKLLLDELTHRVRNTLTVVQSIMHQTWRRAPSGEDFIERMDGRIAALANAHKLLVDSDWQGADLRAVIESQLAAYLGRLRLSGEPVALAASIATPLGLILHELGTNAAKYGALGEGAGYVELAWSVADRNQQALLTLLWKEHDGPPVEATTQMGSGRGSFARAWRAVRSTSPSSPMRAVPDRDRTAEGQWPGLTPGPAPGRALAAARRWPAFACWCWKTSR